MRRKYVTLILITIMVLTASIVFIVLKYQSPDQSRDDVNPIIDDDKQIELSFGDHFISHIMEDGQSMTFNLFGVQKNVKKAGSLKDLISGMEFDNPRLEIMNYDIDVGTTHKDYTLFNILTDIKIKSSNTEEAHQLIIHFKNKNEKVFDIGKIILNNDTDYTDEHVEPKGNYTVRYSNFSLDVNLMSNQNVNVTKIDDLTHYFSHKFDEKMQITSNESKHITINSFDNRDIKDFDFYTVTPILHYTIDNEEYLYNMPSVLYGIMDSEIDMIKKIINDKEGE